MKKISPSELIIVKYLWDMEESGKRGISFKEIFEAVGGERAKQTVNTLLTRLIRFGYIYYEGSEGRRLYFTSISRTAYAWLLLEELFPKLEKKKVLQELRKDMNQKSDMQSERLI